MKNKIFLPAIIALFLFLGPFLYQRASVFFFLLNQGPNPTEYTTLWAASDLHLDTQHFIDFELAINDITENSITAKAAIIVGDIIDYRNAGSFLSKYLLLKKKSGINLWCEVAGNHDHYDIKSFNRYIYKPRQYKREIGNIIILCLSDTDTSSHINISEKSFFWWRKMVVENQDKIIITVTHGHLPESGLKGSIVPHLKNSQRFADVLTKYNVDIWISGHTHWPHSLINNRISESKAYNTLFLNVAAIVKNPYTNIDSNFLIFRKDSSYVLIRSRNHELKTFRTSIDYLHKMRIPFH